MIGVAIFLLIVGVACTKKEGTTATPEKSYNIAAPEKETTINMVGWTMPITDFYKEEFEELNGVKNLTINVQFLDGPSAQEQVRLALSGGKKSAYEIVHASNSQISEWAFPGWLMPLNDLVEKYWDEYDLGDIPQTAWDAATVNGEIVGIPVVSNSFQLIYRSDLFEQHGIDVPTTFEEVIAAAVKLEENEDTIDVPFMLNLQAGWTWEFEYLHFLRAFGADFVNEDGTPAFNNEKGLAALELLVRVAKEAVGEEGLTYSIDDTEIGLQTGRVAFANTWASRAVNMNNPEKSVYAQELKFAPSPAPAPEAGGILGASAWNDFYCIPKTVDVDPELIFKVIMEVADLESQKRAIEHGIPTRMKALESEQAGPYMEAAMTGVSKGVGAFQNHPGVPLVRSTVAEVLPLSLTGDYTLEEVLQRAEDAYLEQARARGIVE